jgi:hypothetical protein
VPLQPPNEELLRADLQAGRNSLDAARDAIANNQVTKDEGKLIQAAAQSRYATAFRRFSKLVLDAEFPAELQ